MPSVFMGFLRHNEAKAGTCRIAHEVNLIVLVGFGDAFVVFQQCLDGILAVVFWRLGIDRHQRIAMCANAEVVKETPMEKHRRVDEGAAMEIEDEFARSLNRPSRLFFVLKHLHLKAR